MNRFIRYIVRHPWGFLAAELIALIVVAVLLTLALMVLRPNAAHSTALPHGSYNGTFPHPVHSFHPVHRFPRPHHVRIPLPSQPAPHITVPYPSHGPVLN